MNIHFIKKAAWRSIQALFISLAGICILIIFYEDVSFYFQFSPHILTAIGLIARHKASIHGAMEIKKGLTISQLSQLQDQLRKSIAIISVIAGMMCPLEIVRVLGKMTRQESVNLDSFYGIILSGLLLIFGILWYYSIGKDQQIERSLSKE